MLATDFVYITPGPRRDNSLCKFINWHSSFSVSRNFVFCDFCLRVGVLISREPTILSFWNCPAGARFPVEMTLPGHGYLEGPVVGSSQPPSWPFMKNYLTATTPMDPSLPKSYLIDIFCSEHPIWCLAKVVSQAGGGTYNVWWQCQIENWQRGHPTRQS